MATSHELDKIYEAGQDAYFDDEDVSENPYEEGTREHDEWKAGWYDAADGDFEDEDEPDGW